MAPFLGSEAVAAGRASEYDLRSRFTAIYPDVYVADDADLTLDDRALGAWLWSGRRAVLCGLTASALHGARYVEDTQPVELVSPNRRPPGGIRANCARTRSPKPGSGDCPRPPSHARC